MTTTGRPVRETRGVAELVMTGVLFGGLVGWSGGGAAGRGGAAGTTDSDAPPLGDAVCGDQVGHQGRDHD
jgi:hypothetical protein